MYIVRWSLQQYIYIDHVCIAVRYRLLFGRCSIRISPGKPADLIEVLHVFRQSIRERSLIMPD
jgi:hypothetical protein